MNPWFKPSLHRQRHEFVIDFVRRNKPKKVVDLGCAECSLLQKLRFHRQIELLVGVDLNGHKLRKKMHGLAPLATDYLQPTWNQLCVQLYQGCLTQKDARFRGFDLATAIELIEHLPLDDLKRFCEVLFGYMAPQTVIISTPNSDFNQLFPLTTAFRHSDHKFEWSREEFQSWSQNVCSKFGYKAKFSGVGQAPPGQEQTIGFCTQIAVFDRLAAAATADTLSDGAEDAFPYLQVYNVTYPSLRDRNILRKTLVSELLYWAEKMKNEWLEKMTTGDREEANPVEEKGKREEGAFEEIFWTNDQEPRCLTLHRHVAVPLLLLWNRCPNLREMSASVANLSQLLIDVPQIKMNGLRSAVIICSQERDLGDEGPNDLLDSGYAESSYVREEHWVLGDE
ncbi:small RNA 2'-O-methyltransferase [Syngnathus scovelli]|uniref:small RNA 2'-O-methyltransferase n=1 Tax=Syngnathus scovelli TaxID=161590 RepID=UPI00210FE9FA|nr:small RNA 2'-O-methyltransferase [Syngnathus scovelli]